MGQGRECWVSIAWVFGWERRFKKLVAEKLLEIETDDQEGVFIPSCEAVTVRLLPGSNDLIGTSSALWADDG